MGGGGDGGYGERQDALERKKQTARDALNMRFGIGPSATGSTVDRSRFVIPANGGGGVDDGGTPGTPEGFDQTGYDAAMGGMAGMGDEAARNKTALDALYSGVRTNAFTAGRRRVDDQKNNASRDLRFELFSRGLNGGSVDIDQNALLGRTYTQGLTDLGARADATATQLRANDESTRVGLLQSIDNGMDQGSAISSAINQLKNNADRAGSEATGMNIGNLFGDAGLLYERGRRAQGEQSAAQMFRGQYGGQYGGRGSASSRTGVESRDNFGGRP